LQQGRNGVRPNPVRHGACCRWSSGSLE
jgi:hypothetical protein